jgi:heme-degrading monooxygenase HmoA
MIVVVFEVSPKEGRAQDYFDLAAALRPELEQVDGFISVERFESLTAPGKYVSLSFWRDADAVAAWHGTENHAVAQARGKSEIFEDFRITVAESIRSYTMADRVGG